MSKLTQRSARRPRIPAVSAAQALFILNAAIWAALGVSTLLREARTPGIMLVIGVMMFGNVALMLSAAWGLGRQTRLTFLFALVVLGVNLILTFTDEVGPLDLATGALDAVIFILLIMTRRHYPPR